VIGILDVDVSAMVVVVSGDVDVVSRRVVVVVLPLGD